MENSFGAGLMAVFAVSGSVILLALHAHKRLLSDFMSKIDCEIGPVKNQPKKKVRFADDVMEQSSEGKAYHKKPSTRPACSSRVADEKLDALPLNWQALYRGIIEYKALRGQN